MNRAFQALALLLSLGMLTFLACRAQSSKPAPAANGMANPASPEAADAPDAAPAPTKAEPEPEVYFPASKSGGAFIEHQQAPH
jgi:hypothetical protein